MKVEDTEGPASSKKVLRGVVDAAVLGWVSPSNDQLVSLLMPLYRLGDIDDDVRSVAASRLLPITMQFVEQLTEEIPQMLVVLWSCLSDMRDHGASTATTTTVYWFLESIIAAVVCELPNCITFTPCGCSAVEYAMLGSIEEDGPSLVPEISTDGPWCVTTIY